MRPQGLSPRRRAGFTIVEVMMAGAVMVFGITTAILTLQVGLRAVDTARNMTLAGQIMQSELEILRLQNWTQITALQNAQASATTPTTIDAATSITTGSSTTLDSTLTSNANRFTCTRLITDISGRSNIKLIVLNISWNGTDGRSHTLFYQTRYAKNGLSDYFYTAH